MQKVALMMNSMGYTDFLMVGGITAIAIYLWTSSKSRSSSTMVDLKKLKVLPSKYFYNKTNIDLEDYFLNLFF